MEPPERNASALVYIMFENPAELKKSWDASAAGRGKRVALVSGTQVEVLTYCLELNHCLYLPGFHMVTNFSKQFAIRLLKVRFDSVALPMPKFYIPYNKFSTLQKVLVFVFDNAEEMNKYRKVKIGSINCPMGANMEKFQLKMYSPEEWRTVQKPYWDYVKKWKAAQKEAKGKR